MRIPLPRIRHFERKREIFFRSRSRKYLGQQETGNTVLPANRKNGVSCKPLYAGKKNTANEKDPSTALGMTIRETAFLIFPFTPLREPISAPSDRILPLEGGRRTLHWLPMQKDYDMRIPLPRIRHFERKREIFFLRGQENMWNNRKRETPCSRRPERTVFHANRSTHETKHGKRKRSLGCARDDDTRDHFPHIPFNPSARANLRPFSLLPWEGGRRTLHWLPMQKDYDMRIPLPRIRHFERKREIFFLRGQENMWNNRKRETPCSRRPERTVFHANRSTQKKEYGKRKRSLGCARDDDIRDLFPHISFHPATMPIKQTLRKKKKPRLSAELFHRQYCPRASMTRSISIGFVR